MRVYYLNWQNESGDNGIWGFWRNAPTTQEQLEFMREHHPDDLPENEEGPGPYGGYIYWQLNSMEQLDA